MLKGVFAQSVIWILLVLLGQVVYGRKSRLLRVKSKVRQGIKRKYGRSGCFASIPARSHEDKERWDGMGCVWTFWYEKYDGVLVGLSGL